MKTKKCGVNAVFAAVLLISTVLITNCVDPLNYGGLTAPPRKALLEVKFPEETARTILPGSTQTFTRYEIDVVSTGLDHSFDKTAAVLTVSAGTGSVAMPEGEYNVTVRAFTGTNPTYILAATGQDLAVEVDSSGGTATIALEPRGVVTSPTPVNGTFTWNLTLPSGGVDTATLNVYNIGTTTPAAAGLTNVDISSTGAINLTGVSIPSGYYDVKVELTKDEYATEIITDVLHIYAGLTSNYVYTFPDLARNMYEVTYANISGGGDSGAGNTFTDTTKFIHGGYVTNYYTTDPTNTTTPSNVFDAWYKEAARSNKWNFSTDRIIGDIILYAGWIPAQTLTVNVSFLNPSDQTLTFSGGTTVNTTQATLLTNPNVVFTLSNFASFDAVTFEYNNTPIATGYVDTTGILTLVFNWTGNMGEEPVKGKTYTITVKVEDDNVTYNGHIYVVIAP